MVNISWPARYGRSATRPPSPQEHPMISESGTRSRASHTTSWGALPAAGVVLAVTARPGQESTELGGLLLAFRQAGASLSLLCLTRGEAAPSSGSARLEAVRPWEVQ